MFWITLSVSLFSFCCQRMCYYFSISVVSSVASLYSSSAVWLKIYETTAGIKNHKSIIKKKKKKHGQIELLAKTKLNTIEVLIFTALIDTYVNHDVFSSANNVLRGCNEMEEEIKNSEYAVEYTMKKQWKSILSVVKKYCKQTF